MKLMTKLTCGLIVVSSEAFVAQQAVAQSSITLYGMVDESIAYANNQKGHSNLYMSAGHRYANRFGFRGDEVLSGTTHAIFDIEAGFDPSTGDSSTAGLIFNRQAYVGLSDSRFGQLTLGRQYSPYYHFVAPLSGSALGTAAASAQPGDIAGLDTTIRINEAITYTSPTIGGLTLGVMLAPGSTSGSVAQGSSISAAASYHQGPFALATGFTHFDNASTANGSWSTSSTATPSNSAIIQGYLSARSMQQFAVAGTYTQGRSLTSLTYANVQFSPDAGSLFTDKAVFNTFEILEKYHVSKMLDVTAEVTYERASKANGIKNAAQYRQVSFSETVFLSKRSLLYFLQGYGRGTGETLGTGGKDDVVAATGLIGDSMNLLPSSRPNQLMAMFGICEIF
ncbi:porin [Paraburkholderia tropica]|uniref:porin n=1 Tax=Paraburkholderia tropica TaxID=92647 RepID=UPI00158FD006|nr:porin [Paraburkholderia tropica]